MMFCFSLDFRVAVCGVSCRLSALRWTAVRCTALLCLLFLDCCVLCLGLRCLRLHELEFNLCFRPIAASPEPCGPAFTYLFSFNCSNLAVQFPSPIRHLTTTRWRRHARRSCTVSQSESLLSRAWSSSYPQASRPRPLPGPQTFPRGSGAAATGGCTGAGATVTQAAVLATTAGSGGGSTAGPGAAAAAGTCMCAVPPSAVGAGIAAAAVDRAKADTIHDVRPRLRRPRRRNRRRRQRRQRRRRPHL